MGIFAEPLMETERFVRMVGRERLMTSDLITYLMEERFTEQERAHAAQLEQERAACDNSAMSNGYKHSMLWCWGRRTRQAWSGSYKRRDAD